MYFVHWLKNTTPDEGNCHEDEGSSEFFWSAIELSILLEVDTYDNDDGKDWNDVLIFGICAGHEIFFPR